MAFLLSKESDKIKVIARCDDALIRSNDEEFDIAYSSYLEDLDESKLQFVAEKTPTRFVMKKNLNLSEHIRIKNDQMKMSGKGEISIQMGYTVEEVRLCLVGIENPPGTIGCLEYKADGGGGATRDLMEKLIGVGLIDDLHSALTFSRKSKSINKKN